MYVTSQLHCNFVRVFKALYHLHDVILIIKVILFDASLNNLVITIAFSFQCIKHRHLG